jgi:hypothetical protein
VEVRIDRVGPAERKGVAQPVILYRCSDMSTRSPSFPSGGHFHCAPSPPTPLVRRGVACRFPRMPFV